MSLVDRVRKALSRGGEKEAPESVCANCWGHYEYGDEIRQKMKYHRYTLDSTDGRAFIEEFVVKHIDGIDLEPVPNGLRCPRCKLVHSS